MLKTNFFYFYEGQLVNIYSFDKNNNTNNSNQIILSRIKNRHN